MVTSKRGHTHNFHKCSHASMGLAQARPNNYFLNSNKSLPVLLQSYVYIFQFLESGVQQHDRKNVHMQWRRKMFSNRRG